MRQYRLRYQRRSGIDELVAGPPHGRDEPRVRRVRLDLLAQPLHERVDAPLGDVRVGYPDALDERVTAEHDAAVAGEHVQQIELVGGELDVAAVQPREPPRRIDVQLRHG